MFNKTRKLRRRVKKLESLVRELQEWNEAVVGRMAATEDRVAQLFDEGEFRRIVTERFTTKKDGFGYDDE